MSGASRLERRMLPKAPSSYGSSFCVLRWDFWPPALGSLDALRHDTMPWYCFKPQPDGSWSWSLAVCWPGMAVLAHRGCVNSTDVASSCRLFVIRRARRNTCCRLHLWDWAKYHRLEVDARICVLLSLSVSREAIRGCPEHLSNGSMHLSVEPPLEDALLLNAP